MAALTEALVRPAPRVAGRLRVPGDKSISHRYALLAALADGESTFANFAPGADCAATLDCLRAVGVQIAVTTPQRPDGATDRVVTIVGRGLHGLQTPRQVLDACNSGTTMRLLSGILAAHPGPATITGDESLRRRPMRRVIAPLAAMGARIDSADGRAPLTIRGGSLHPITFEPPVPSAQIKSAVLLAGLLTQGRTTIVEPVPTRNHTELALPAFGARLEVRDGTVIVEGEVRLSGLEAAVPGDISSAAFWAAAAAALPGSDIEILDVGLNPSRTALLDVLSRAGADVEQSVERTAHGEPVGRVRVRHRGLRPLRLTASDVPAVIDELPALAAMASLGGDLHVTGAAELRVKESDRIAALATGLRALGADIDEFPDGFHVRGHGRLPGGEADAAHDHRLAMAFSIAALGADQPSTITGAEAVAVSYPGFFDTLAAVTREDG
jgi:3-phosphoshikimate 1-carboxyvinyltransferase